MCSGNNNNNNNTNTNTNNTNNDPVLFEFLVKLLILEETCTYHLMYICPLVCVVNWYFLEKLLHFFILKKIPVLFKSLQMLFE